ncbi:SLC13 family permease [Paenibacillus sp. FSL R10-2734]|uniref:SLC13 family permease n=1 Tax=Paenibacillus sp. FSL R10-2734 TaxID=2954691 RepID=UPI0030DC8A1D
MRSAGAQAAVETTLYVIDRKMFDRLIAENATLSAYFIRLLSQRLTVTNGRLQAVKENEHKRLEQELEELPKEIKQFILWCSHIPVVNRELSDYTFGFSLREKVQIYPSLRSYFRGILLEEERLELLPSLKPTLHDICKNKFGYEEMALWYERALNWYEAEGNWAAVIEMQGAQEDWGAALNTYVRVKNELLQEEREVLFDLFVMAPVEVLASQCVFLQDYIPYCVLHHLEKGLALVEVALNGAESFSSRELLSLYEWGTELCRRLGKDHQALEYLQLADIVADAMADRKVEAVNSDRAYGLAKQKLARKRSQQLARGAARLGKGNRWLGPVAVITALLCVVLSFVIEPVGNLSANATAFIGIAIAAVILWIVNIIPDYVVALGMVMLWVVGGITDTETALSGFASGTWIFMICIMGFSAVITKSGISYRFALHALKRFPSSYRGQLWGIVAGGMMMNPLIPSSSAKVSLGVPVAHTLSESMGYRERSNGAAGLGLAAMVFYGFTAPFVMTGSYTNVMAYGLVTDGQQVTWLQWLLYALPALIVFGGVILVFLSFMFRNVSGSKMVSGDVLNEQLALPGPLTKEERISLWTIIGCIVFMVLQPLHGLDNTWVMLIGFAVLAISGVLDKGTLSSGIDWPFLLFLGVAFSFAGVSDQLGIAKVLSSFLNEHMSLFVSSPILFLLAVIMISFVVTLVIRDDPAVILLVTALLPIGAGIGIHPWVLVFLILLSTDPFFFAYQSPTYLTAYYSAEGKAFTHKQARKIALGYGLAVILLAILCIPYWRWLGLIP